MTNMSSRQLTGKRVPYRLLAGLVLFALSLAVLFTATPVSRAYAQTIPQHVSRAHTQRTSTTSNCLGVHPHILPQKNTTPTIEQLWVVVTNGCSTVAQGGQVAITDSIRCSPGGQWQTGYSTTVVLPSLQPAQAVTPWNIQAYNTGCSGTGASGPEEEWLHADALAEGPGGQSYSGSGDAYYTFS